MAEHKISDIFQEIRQPKGTSYAFDCKKEDRRAAIYRMYTVDSMTQQEIADKLNLTRSTVISDIKKYKRDHPEEIDKTYL